MKTSSVLNCGLYLKTGKWDLSWKRENDSNSGYVRKWQTWHGLKRTPFRIFILTYNMKLEIGNWCSRHV